MKRLHYLLILPFVLFSFTLLYGQGPTITLQPQNQSVLVGEAATFTLTATGINPLLYQWFKDGVLISGANSNSYLTTVAEFTDNGSTFYCVVFDSSGNTESSHATLSVSYPNNRVTNDLQVLYDFSEGSGNIVGDVSGVGSSLDLIIENSNEVIWTPKGLYSNVTNPIKSDVVATKIIDACKLSNEITIEAWVVPANFTQGSSGPVRIITLSENSTNRNFALAQEMDSWDARLRTTTTSDNGLPSLASGASSVESSLNHIIYTRNSTGEAKIYVNGILKQTASVSGDFSNWNSSYFFGLGDEFNSDKSWEGLYYLSAIYSRALTMNEVTQNFIFGVNYDNKPIIIEEPIGQSVTFGSAATFSIKALGEGSLTYQWQKNGSNISGANNPSYTTPITNLSDNGSTFRCIVSNANGSDNSLSVTLFVTPIDTRITTGQQVLYKFEQGSGTVVLDISGVGSPLNLNILTPDAVEWTNSGLMINSPANIISDVAASKIVDACKITNEITIEAWVKPANTLQNGPARIITNSLDRASRNFTFGQEFDDYQVGLRTSSTDNGGVSLNSNDGSATTALTHVVYTRSAIGVAKLFINGTEVVQNNSLTGDFSNWNSNYRLSVGNELIDQRPYEGLLHLIAVFNRQLKRAEIEHNYSIGVSSINNPTNLVASEGNIGEVNLSWTDNSSNEDGFIIERSEGLPLIYTEVSTVAENVTNFIDDTVLEGKNYAYRIKAFNAIVSSDFSNVDTVISQIFAPSDLEGVAIVLGEISLTWTDNSSNEDGYIINRAIFGSDSEQIGSVTSNIKSFVDETVSEGIKYTYTVLAFVGNEKSSESNGSTLYSKASFINKPLDLTITIHETYGVPVLEWVDDSFNEKGFFIERRLTSVGSNFVLIDSTGVNDTTYVDDSVNDSTSYIYRVFAFNDERISDYSSEVFIDVLVGVNGNININKFNLSQNYPNPFNPTTTISFSLPESSKINLVIYNMLGEVVSEVANGQYSSGFHSLDFNASNLTSGIYFYSIKASTVNGNNFINTKKMILMK